MKKNSIKKEKVIGVIMTYNCARLLSETYKKIPKTVFDELIVIDDGSTDRVSEVAKKLKLKFFTHKHGGYGVNLRFGLKKAVDLGGEYVFEIHGDAQFNPERTKEGLSKMKKDDLDFLIGSRFMNLKHPLDDGMPLFRYLANIGLSFVEKMALKVPLSEFHPGFRAYRRRFIEKLDYKNVANDYLYSFEVIVKAAEVQARCGEIPIRVSYKGEHTSVNYKKAAINSFQEIWLVVKYLGRKLEQQVANRFSHS